jgi:hypothetical protein
MDRKDTKSRLTNSTQRLEEKTKKIMAKQATNAAPGSDKDPVITTEVTSYDIAIKPGAFSLQVPKECQILTLVNKTFGSTLYVSAPVASELEEVELYFIDDTGTIPDGAEYVLSFPINPGKPDLRQAAYHLYRA